MTTCSGKDECLAVRQDCSEELVQSRGWSEESTAGLGPFSNGQSETTKALDFQQL